MTNEQLKAALRVRESEMRLDEAFENVIQTIESAVMVSAAIAVGICGGMLLLLITVSFESGFVRF